MKKSKYRVSYLLQLLLEVALCIYLITATLCIYLITATFVTALITVGGLAFIWRMTKSAFNHIFYRKSL